MEAISSLENESRTAEKLWVIYASNKLENLTALRSTVTASYLWFSGFTGKIYFKGQLGVKLQPSWSF